MEVLEKRLDELYRKRREERKISKDPDCPKFMREEAKRREIDVTQQLEGVRICLFYQGYELRYTNVGAKIKPIKKETNEETK
jgi:hypothetical protein